MNQRYFLIAAVATCSVAGFVIGRISSQSSNPESVASESVAYAGGEAPPRPMVGPRVASEMYNRADGPRRAGSSGLSSRQYSSISYTSLPMSARVSSITQHPNSVERARLWLEFVDGLSPAEIKQVIDGSIRGERKTLNITEYRMLITAWAEKDPRAAFEHSEKISPGSHLQVTVMTAWAMKDPASALSWAEQNHDGQGANPLMPGVIKGIAVNDPQRAAQLVNDMPDSKERIAALDGVVPQFARMEPEAARDWAMSLEDDGLRADAIEGVAEQLAYHDPKAAADWLISNPSEASARAMDDVMASMTLADSMAAIKYMENIGDPAIRSRALEGIANELSTIDPRTTLALIDANPTLVNDDIVRELVWGARANEPDIGAHAIIRIQDEGIRKRTYYRYFDRWLRSDYNAAVEWANRNELPEDARRSVDFLSKRIRDRQ